MTRQNQWTTVGQLPQLSGEESTVPLVLTRAVWLLVVVSLGVLALQFVTGARWEVPGLVAIDGVTGVLWVTVTVLGGIIHSYSRRYMAGTRHVERFFAHIFAFVVLVMGLVAADHIALFAGCWLAMGLVMARLIGHVDGWPHAQRAAALARRYFVGSSGILALAMLALWWQTGATTITGIAAAIETVPVSLVLLVGGLLVLVAMVQSALLPFHTWLLSSMTAPTPASALMHAGFVNAGAVVLLRFAPVITVDSWFMLAIVLVGAVSALLGKLLKTVQTDVKRRLGCSTVGQMGFMIMQVGLGFFGAAITHLILHGFYKAYQFLGAGEPAARKPPTAKPATGTTSVTGLLAMGLTALAGGAVFALLTGKGTALDTGLLLTLLVVLTTLHAARQTVRQSGLPSAVRYGGVALVFLPAIALYGLVYRFIEGQFAGLPGVGTPEELTVLHGVVAAAFLVAYLAIESGVYQRSHRLYVTLQNWSQPPTSTLLTTTEDYHEY